MAFVSQTLWAVYQALPSLYITQPSATILQAQNDADLAIFWDALGQAKVPLPPIEEAAKRRVWLNDDANSTLLGQVKELGLCASDLRAVPPEVLRCPNLTWLNLEQTNITEIPDWICKFSKLEALVCNMTGITSLPDSMRTMMSLKRLDMYFTNIAFLPDWIGELSLLEVLSCPETVTGLPLSARRLHQLRNLQLWNCTDRDLAIISDFSNLENLFIRKSPVKAFPDSIGKLMKLKYLTVWDGQLETISTWLDSLFMLESLNCSFNAISSITARCDNLPHLHMLTLRYNRLKEIPESFANLTAVSWLELDGNQISSFPEKLCYALQSLTRLQLAENPLQHIPDAIGKLKSLDTLFLNSTQLQTLPDALTELPNIKYVSAEGSHVYSISEVLKNYFTGNRVLRISQKASRFPKMAFVAAPASTKSKGIGCKGDDFDLFWHCLAQQIVLPMIEDVAGRRKWLHDPANKALLGTVTCLNFYAYSLRAIPRECFLCPNVTYINLGQTAITKLPEEIGTFAKLEHLDLNQTMVSALPESLCKATSLKFLNIEYTRITSLPAWIGAFSKLEVLRCPETVTALPQSLCHLSQLQKLSVWNCTAEDMWIICNLLNLQNLYIRKSPLTVFPDSFRKLVKMRELRLVECKLETISTWIDSFPELEVLWGDYSAISRITARFDNLPRLRYLLFTYMQLTEIPESFATLSDLRVLALTSNQIKSIPEKLCRELQKLTELRLDKNPLQSIPEAIGDLQSLETLNLTLTQLCHLPDTLTLLPKIKYIAADSTHIQSVSERLKTYFTHDRRLSFSAVGATLS